MTRKRRDLCPSVPIKLCRDRYILETVNFTEITAVESVSIGIYGLRLYTLFRIESTGLKPLSPEFNPSETTPADRYAIPASPVMTVHRSPPCPAADVPI